MKKSKVGVQETSRPKTKVNALKQLAALDERLGKGVGALKERSQLHMVIDKG